MSPPGSKRAASIGVNTGATNINKGRTCDFLNRSVLNALRLYNHYEEQRRREEILCHDCIVLFKQWPSKIQKAVLQPAENPESLEREKLSVSDAPLKNGETVVSEREKDEIAMVDNLLFKAQKIRERHDKVSEGPRSKPTKSQPVGRDTVKPLKATTKDNVKVTNEKLSKPPTQPGVKQKSSRTTNSQPKYVPAHVTAPYKADPNLHKKRLRTKPQSGRSSEHKVRTDNAQSVKHSDTQETLTDFENSVDSAALCEEQTGDVSSSKLDNPSPALRLHESDRYSSKPEGRTEENLVNSKKDMEFLLSRDGSKLSLPTKFKKLYSKNLKMKDKLQQSSSDSLTNGATKFLDKCENLLRSSKDQCCQLHYSAFSLEEDYKSVSSLLETAKLLSISETCSAKDVLKAKIILADVLSRFYSMEEEYQLILKSFKMVKSKNLVSEMDISTTADRLRPPGRSSEVSLEYPQNPFPSVPSLYKSERKLAQYAGLFGQVDALRVEKQVLETASVEILEYLKNLTPEDGSFLETYRTGYMMLCSSGRRFPTMVRDTASSEESED